MKPGAMVYHLLGEEKALAHLIDTSLIRHLTVKDFGKQTTQLLLRTILAVLPTLVTLELQHGPAHWSSVQQLITAHGQTLRHLRITVEVQLDDASQLTDTTQQPLGRPCLRLEILGFRSHMRTPIPGQVPDGSGTGQYRFFQAGDFLEHLLRGGLPHLRHFELSHLFALGAPPAELLLYGTGDAVGRLYDQGLLPALQRVTFPTSSFDEVPDGGMPWDFMRLLKAQPLEFYDRDGRQWTPEMAGRWWMRASTRASPCASLAPRRRRTSFGAGDDHALPLFPR